MLMILLMEIKISFYNNLNIIIYIKLYFAYYN